MSVKDFENERWGRDDQVIGFRHKAALELAENGTALDIGCGDGLFLKMLKGKNIRGKGIDISEEAVKKCKEKNLDASVCDFSSGNLPFHDNEFDCVVMLDVLEHLYFPGNVLREAKRVSKKYLIVSVPNFNSLPARIQTLLGRVPENNRPNKGHVFWFNYGILKKMADNSNLRFVDMRVNTFWQDYFLAGAFSKFLAKIWPSLFALSFVVKLEK